MSQVRDPVIFRLLVQQMMLWVACDLNITGCLYSSRRLRCMLFRSQVCHAGTAQQCLSKHQCHALQEDDPVASTAAHAFTGPADRSSHGGREFINDHFKQVPSCLPQVNSHHCMLESTTDTLYACTHSIQIACLPLLIPQAFPMMRLSLHQSEPRTFVT